MRKLAAVMIAVFAIAACGSSGSSKSGPATGSTVASREAKAFVDATLAGLIASTPKSQRANLQSDMSCLATAIVDGIGVARLKAAGVTLAKLRDPNFQPPARVARSMSAVSRRAFAVPLQACGIGRIIGSQAAQEFAKGKNPGVPIDARAVQCIGRGFEGAAARPMVAGTMLNDPTAADAERLARLFVGCLDMAPILASGAGLTLSATEDRCIEGASRTDPAFVKLLADQFRGVKSTATSATTRFGASVIACLTPAHVAQLNQSGG
jgi:hypothetical protein